MKSGWFSYHQLIHLRVCACAGVCVCGLALIKVAGGENTLWTYKSQEKERRDQKKSSSHVKEEANEDVTEGMKRGAQDGNKKMEESRVCRSENQSSGFFFSSELRAVASVTNVKRV